MNRPVQTEPDWDETMLRQVRNDPEAIAYAARKCAVTLSHLADQYEADGNRAEAARLRDNAEWHLRLAEWQGVDDASDNRAA